MLGSVKHRLLYTVALNKNLCRKAKKSYVECSIWTLSNTSTIVKGHHMRFSQPHDKRPLSSGVVTCSLPEVSYEANIEDKSTSHGRKIKPDPVSRVALSTNEGKSQNYSASIPVEDLTKRTKRGEINVCVKEMHSKYNKVTQLVEFIELQRILGADHFTFYNLSIGPDVDRVLQHYVKEGVAEVLPCSAPGPVNVENMRRVVIAMLNDCVLRSMGRYPLVAVTDVDEIIIPRQVDNILKMVEELGNFAEYNFQNAFFYLLYDDDANFKRQEGAAVDSNLWTQRKTRRIAKPTKHKDRSKYLCRPEEVIDAGVHYVHRFVAGGKTLWVDANTALSHHYRGKCVDTDIHCEKMTTTRAAPTQPTLVESEHTLSGTWTPQVDRTAQRFRDPLRTAVTSSCKAIFPNMDGCPAQ